MKIACVFGTRPEIIKLAPVIHAFREPSDSLVLIHTGQHYDPEMSGVFLADLNIPDPDYNLGIGSGTRAAQISGIMTPLEAILRTEKPDVVLLQGDTNTVTGAAIVARQLLIPVGHIEAGLRSLNEQSPEEVNRKIASQLSLIHFAPTSLNRSLLIREGIPAERIYVTGNTVIDSLRQWTGKINPAGILEGLRIGKQNPIILVTVHRSTTVDDPERLAGIFRAIAALDRYSIIFPVHPRTGKNADLFGILGLLEKPHIHLTGPLDYQQFLSIMSASRLLITDSGGVQEEATAMGKPVVIVREGTSRWESVVAGVSILSGVSTEEIVGSVRKFETDHCLKQRLEEARSLYGDGRSGERIAGLIREWHATGRLRYPAPEKGVPGIIRAILIPEGTTMMPECQEKDEPAGEGL